MKKSILLAMLTLATVSYGTMAVAVESTSEARVSDEPPPPPPPPPPPQSETKAQSKAAKIYTYAQDVVTKHKAYEQVLTPALKDPNNEKKAEAVLTAVQALADAIDTLMRNTKSLENDVKKILAQERGEIKEEVREVRKQKGNPRKQSEVDLLNELKERLKKRAGETVESDSKSKK